MNKNAKKLTMLLAIGKPSKVAKGSSFPQPPTQPTSKQTATTKKKKKVAKKGTKKSNPMMMKGNC